MGQEPIRIPLSMSDDSGWPSAGEGWRTSDDLAQLPTPRVSPSVERDYDVLGLLGQGAMGAVFRVRDRQTGRELALKQPHGVLSPTLLERFRREGEATARLNHAGIVRIHAARLEGDQPFLVHELLEGCCSLEEHCAGLPWSRIVELVRDAARALGHAHARGVVHRDVKPENLLVDSSGRLRVADFGLAFLDDLARLTTSGQMLGTPVFMSPEQLLGDSTTVGPWSDVWSLGVVLYELTTGTRSSRSRASPGS